MHAAANFAPLGEDLNVPKMSDIVVGLVEDDAVQAELFEAMLCVEGLRTQRFASVNEFRQRSGAASVDVLLLDWNLPDVSGIDLLRSLRAQTSKAMPIILLTANHNESDIVYGLHCGADDYIVKPPRPAELVARVRAANRRNTTVDGAGIANSFPFEFDLLERELRIDGVPVSITEREFDLLVYFFRRPTRVISRQMLLSDVWNLGPQSSTRSIDTYVSRLRKSVGLNGECGWKLEGVYQHGYRLTRSHPIANVKRNAIPRRAPRPDMSQTEQA